MINILLIEDSAFQREIIRSKLSTFDFKIITATNGLEGLIIIEESKPDIIIVDLLMPQMNGLEFIKELKNRNINVPIIVNSADIQETTRSECLKLGVFAFLNKPFKKQDIFDTINKALESRKNG